MRRWRRIVHAVVIYGLIGLALNILAAWGFALWGEVKPGRVAASKRVAPPGGPIDLDPNLSWSRASPLLASQPLFRVTARGFGVHALMEATPIVRSGPDGKQLRLAEFGWPMRSLRWHDIMDWSYAPIEVRERGWFVELPSQQFTSIEMTMLQGFRGLPRRLPLEPVWAGLAANTAIFGGALWVTIGGVSGARVLVRRRRGRCPRCGYDLRRDFKGGCPECGWRRAETPASA